VQPEPLFPLYWGLEEDSYRKHYAEEQTARQCGSLVGLIWKRWSPSISLNVLPHSKDMLRQWMYILPHWIHGI